MHSELKIPYELQRIADALEASNELQKQNIELFKKSMEDNEERYKEAMGLSVRSVEATQTWIDWNKQRIIEDEDQQRLSSNLLMKSSDDNDSFYDFIGTLDTRQETENSKEE